MSELDKQKQLQLPSNIEKTLEGIRTISGTEERVVADIRDIIKETDPRIKAGLETYQDSQKLGSIDDTANLNETAKALGELDSFIDEKTAETNDALSAYLSKVLVITEEDPEVGKSILKKLENLKQDYEIERKVGNKSITRKKLGREIDTVLKKQIKSGKSNILNISGAPGSESPEILDTIESIYQHEATEKNIPATVLRINLNDFLLEGDPDGKKSIDIFLRAIQSELLDQGFKKELQEFNEVLNQLTETVSKAKAQKLGDVAQQAVDDLSDTLSLFGAVPGIATEGVKKGWRLLRLGSNLRKAWKEQKAESKINNFNLKLVKKHSSVLSDSLVKALSEVAKKKRLVIMIEGCEKIDSHNLHQFLQKEFLPKLPKKNVLSVIADENDHEQDYVENYPESCNINLDKKSLYTEKDIKSLAANYGLKFNRKELSQIKKVSSGVPYVVKSLLGKLKMANREGEDSFKELKEKILSGKDNSYLLESQERILQNYDEDTANQILGLAMSTELSTDLIKKLQGEKPDIKAWKNTMNRVSFLDKNGHMRPLVKGILRKSLVSQLTMPGGHWSNDNIRETGEKVMKSGEQTKERLKEQLKEQQKLFRDKEYQAAYLQELEGKLWQRNKVAVEIILTDLDIVLADPKNINFAYKILNILSEFDALMEDYQRDQVAGVKQKIGISLTTKEKQRLHKRLFEQKHPAYPERAQIDPSEISWHEKSSEYKPVDFTSEKVLKGEGGWENPDPEDFTKIDFQNRSFNTPIPVNKEGKPLNPMGRTGIEGRGYFRYWGENPAGDFVLTKEENGKIYAALIERTDSDKFAIPGGFYEAFDGDGDKVPEREAMEEILHGKNIDYEKVPLDKAKTIFKGYVDDPRNTDNAWASTTVKHFNLSNEQAQALDLNAGSDARSVQWIEVNEELLNKMYASHGDYLRLALNEVKKV